MKLYNSTIASPPKDKPGPWFCWQCGKKLRSKYRYQMEWEGHLRTFHKSCAENLSAEAAEEKVSDYEWLGGILMPLKLGPITPEMLEALDKADQAETEFWERQGFPEYNAVRKRAEASVAHRAWVKCVETEGTAYDSPMARRMFILGWLKRNAIV